jgi:hypothetical protein
VAWEHPPHGVHRIREHQDARTRALEVHDVHVRLPYRLDLSVDLFAVDVDGVTVVTSQAELEALSDGLDSLHGCWPDPHPACVWAVVTRALGRDPRL